MDNKLYEYGGTADVLIKCKTARKIGGTDYQEGEPYTYLKDVVVQLAYEHNNTDASGKKPVLASSDGRPYQLTIGGIPLTKKIINLILSQKQEQYEYTKKEIITCWENGKLELSQAVSNNNVFCYDEDFNLIKIELANDNKTILGNFITDTEYLVFYSIIGTGDVYGFEIPYYPYFSIEIFGKGNTDKATNNIYMNFDAAALASVPNFNIINGGLLNTPLVFKLIYQYQKEPIVVFD